LLMWVWKDKQPSFLTALSAHIHTRQTHTTHHTQVYTHRTQTHSHTLDTHTTHRHRHTLHTDTQYYTHTHTHTHTWCHNLHVVL